MDACDISPMLQIEEADGTITSEPSILFQQLMDRGLTRDEALAVYMSFGQQKFIDAFGDWMEGEGPLNNQGEPEITAIPDVFLEVDPTMIPNRRNLIGAPLIGSVDFQTPRMTGSRGPTLSMSDVNPNLSLNDVLDVNQLDIDRKKKAIKDALRGLEIRIQEFNARSGEQAKKGSKALKKEKDAIEALLAKNLLDEAIVRYAEHAVKTMNLLTERIKTLLERGELSLSDLHDIYSYSQGYKIVTDLVNEIEDDKGLRNTFNGEVLKSLRGVMSQIQYIERSYTNYGSILIARRFAAFDTETEKIYENKFRKDFEADKNVQEGEDLPIYLTRRFLESNTMIQRAKEQSILKKLNFLEHDVGRVEQLVSGVQHMDDRIIQIAHDMIWRKHDDIRSEYQTWQIRIEEAYRNLVKYKGNTVNQEKLYEEILEEDLYGNLTDHLVSEELSQFDIAMREMFERARMISESEGKKKAAIYRDAWFKENAKENPDYAAFRKKLKGIRRAEGPVEAQLFEERWHDQNPNTTRWMPNDKWKSNKYEKLMTLAEDHPVRAFYTTVVEAQQYFDSIRPQDKQLGTRLPGIRSDAMERLTNPEGGVVGNTFDVLKDNFKIQQDDDQYGMQTVEEGIDGAIKKTIPVYYTKSFRDEFIKDQTEGATRKERSAWVAQNEQLIADYVKRNQSYDVTSLVLANAYTALNYKHLSEVLPEMQALEVILANRDVAAGEAGFKKIFRPVLGQSDERIAPIKGGRAFKVFKEMLDRDIYGEKRIPSRFDKAADVLMSYVAGTMLQLNLFSGIRNVSVGAILNLTETFGGRYVDGRGWKRAHARYFKDMPNITADLGKNEYTAMTNLLSEEFDAQNDFQGRRHRYADSNWLLKQMKGSTLYGLTTMGEHFLSHMTMYAVLDKVEARDADGKSLGSLLELYTKGEDGQLTLSTTPATVVWDNRVVEWGPDTKFKITQRMRHVNEMMHGAYSQQNAPLAARHVQGRLILMMRKWLVPGINRRWGGTFRAWTGRSAMKWEQQVGEYEEGSYVTLGREVKRGANWTFRHIAPQFMKDLAQDTKMFQWLVQADWDTLSDFQKSNVKKATLELAFFAAAMIAAQMVAAAAEGEDDEDAKRRYNRLAFILFSIEREIGFYFMPTELTSVVQDVSPVVSTLVTINKAFGHALSQERYVSGRREGELKLKKDLIALSPWYRHWDRWQNPEEMLSFFNDKR